MSNSLSPQLSDTWHADEVFVKMKGGEKEKQYRQKNMAYLWNVMDRKTRFLLASSSPSIRNVKERSGPSWRQRTPTESQPERDLHGRPERIQGSNGLWESESRPEQVARMGVGSPTPTTTALSALTGRSASASRFRGDGSRMKTPARRRPEDSLQLREAPHGVGRADSRRSGGNRVGCKGISGWAC